MKRFFSLLIAACLLLSMVPAAQVFAVNTVVAEKNGVRELRDLNAKEVADYEITDSDVVNITVYLDGTNGADTNNGLSEDKAVKTLEKAYMLMENAVDSVSGRTGATLVIVGMYDLGAKQSHLPAAFFPVTITGKNKDSGFSFTGGSSLTTRTFELHGDTTFQNLRLHVNNSQSYNFLIANGHKLVLGEGINTTVNKANCYFTVIGGDYGYTDINASTEVTICSGSWYAVYVGGYRGSVTGNAKLTMTGGWVYSNIAATYSGNIGSVEMNIENTAVEKQSTAAIYMGPVEYNASYQVGAVLGDSVLTLGKNVSAQAVYGSSRNRGNIEGNAVVKLAGADLNQVPLVAMSPITAGTTGGHKLVLAEDITNAVTLDSAFTLDLNGYDITGDIFVDGAMTVFDSATDDYDVSDGNYGEITGAVTGALVAEEGYIAAANGFHKFGGHYISGVSLRPGNAGIYYTATFLADKVLLETMETGVAVSLVDLPGADFETDSDTCYTTGTTGVMIENILAGDGEDADRGIMDIYAATYVKFADGTVQTSKETIAYSLYDILLLLQTQNPEAFQSFVETHNLQNWF